MLGERIVGAQPDQQGRHPGQCPRLLGPNHPLGQDLLRHQAGMDLADPESLQTEPVANREGRGVVTEGWDGENVVSTEPVEAVENVDLEAEILSQVSCQPGHLDRIPRDQQFVDLSPPVDAPKEPDRTLNFRDQVVEHGPHGLEDQFRVGCLPGIPLQMLRLREG